MLGWLKRLFVGDKVGDWDTSGPSDDEHPLVFLQHLLHLFSNNEFVAGLWQNARYLKAHPGRVGPAIVPKTAVIHTTDMMPDSFDALVKAWTTKASTGACAHFLIGRDKNQGVVQFVPITRNGNHAGGSKGHGWYKSSKTGKVIHPNTVSVGIELHSAGHLVKQSNGTWKHRDSGRLVPKDDVYVDSRGKGWMRVTPYQLGMLSLLLQSLQLPGLSEEWCLVSNGTYAENGVNYFAPTTQTKVVGHVTMDPLNKQDPGPQVMQWLNEQYK